MKSSGCDSPAALRVSLFSDARRRGPLRLCRHSFPVLVAAALLLGTAAGPAQNGAPYNTGPRTDRNQGLDAPAAPDPLSRAQEEQLTIRRINERQKTIVADTTRLLELAQQLKVEVDKSNKDQLSLSVVKKAEEVEKLARAVKEKMKGF